jgi:hypothetical protein
VEEVKKETHRFAKKIDSLAKEKMALKIDEDDEVEAPPILSAEELEEYNVQELTAVCHTVTFVLNNIGHCLAATRVNSVKAES